MGWGSWEGGDLASLHTPPPPLPKTILYVRASLQISNIYTVPGSDIKFRTVFTPATTLFVNSSVLTSGVFVAFVPASAVSLIGV